MKAKAAIVAMLATLTIPFHQAMAATSTMNGNVRIFEDTIWLMVFTSMIVAGFLMGRLSGSTALTGYVLLSLTGVFGWVWKGIGLVKRVLVLNEPAWLFSVTREAFEGLTGIALALASIVLVYSFVGVYKGGDA